MKRRGFLGMLFGAPAAGVAGAALGKVESKFPRGLVESEPEPVVVRNVAYSQVDCVSAAIDNYATAVSPMVFKKFRP